MYNKFAEQNCTNFVMVSRLLIRILIIQYPYKNKTDEYTC